MKYQHIVTAQDSAEYYPTLFIGLGGSGMKAVRTILLYGNQVRSDLPAYDESLRLAIKNGRVAGLGIDTDANEFSGIRVHRQVFPDALAPHFEAGLFATHYPEVKRRVVARRGDINNAIRVARHLGRWLGEDEREMRTDELRAAQLVDSFLAVDRKLYDQLLPPGDESEDGAGQMRALGRVAFLCALPDIADALSTARNDIAPLCGRQRMRVAIFASLAGGTGSGMFLDIATLIRKILIHDAHITGHFLLPEVFDSVSVPKRIWPNTYAALMELAQVARPQNDRTIHVNYRRNDRDQLVSVRSGDGAIFNDLFLYDESAACLDHSLTGQTLPAHRVEVAARAMADTALALSRRDLIERNPNRQNMLVGRRNNTDVTRRLFHEAMATPWLPKPVTDLSQILDAMIYFELFEEPLQNLRILPEGHNDKARDDVDEMLKRLEGDRSILLDWEQGDIARRMRDNGDEKLERAWVQNWRREMEDQALSGKELERMATRELLKKRNLDRLAKRLYNGLMRDTLKAQAGDEHSGKDGESADGMARRIEFSVFDYFEGRAQEIWLPLQKLVEDLERLSEIEHEPNEERLTKLKRVRTRIKVQIAEAKRQKASVDPSAYRISQGMIPFDISNVIHRNRSTLAMLYEKAEQEREDAVARIKSGAHGPLGIEFDQLGREFEDAMRRSVNPDVPRENAFCEEDLARHWAVNGKIDDTLARFDDVLEKLQAQRDHYRSQSAILENHFGSDPQNLDRRTARFDDIMKPVIRVADELYALQLNLGQIDVATRKRLKNRQELLVRLMHEAHGDNLTELDDKSYQDFFLDLKEALDDPAYQSIDRRHICAAVAKTLCKTLLAREAQVATSLPGQSRAKELENRLNNISAFTKAFIEMWLRLPEFEYSRYGGKEGIRQSALGAQTAVFNASAAPGALHVRCATLALAPAASGQSDDDTTEQEILSAINGALQTRPILASNSSQQPMLLHEARYNAAYQLRNIDRYRMEYEDLAEDERPLYHVLPEGPDFPRLMGAEPHENTQLRWECHEHDEPYPVSADVLYCPECVREYYRGVRRLQDITRQSAGVPVPSLDEEGSLDKANPIPLHLEDYFWLGVEEPERTDDLLEKLAQEGREKRLSGRWKSDAPPKLTFPQVPTEDLEELEHVAREPWTRHGQFVRRTTGTRLFECFHCSFPIIDDLKDSASSPHSTCPRCRRRLSYCLDCSDTHKHYVEKRPSHDGVNSHECPSCKTTRLTDE